jgi:hypothetical protein
MNTVSILPHTDKLPPKYGAIIRAPSISIVMMQKPLTNAALMTSRLGID